MLTEGSLFAKALQIESPWFIEEIRFDAEGGKLEIFIDFERGATFYYKDGELGVEGHFKAYDKARKSWRHLNFFQFECLLHAQVPRVDLGNGKIRRVQTSWEGASFGFTLLFEAFLLQLCRAMPVHRVAELVGTSDRKLWEMLGTYVAQARAGEDFSWLEQIALDETAARRGHDYVTIFASPQGRKTVFVTKGKGAEAVAAFARELEEKHGKVESIAQVSCDMSPAFIKGIKENFPNADIVFDRFHVMAVIQKAVDAVRRMEAKFNPILNRTKYIFLKNAENLTEKQSEKLHNIRMSRLNLKTMKALEIREAFQQVYQAHTTAEFELLLGKWYFWATHSRIDPIIHAAKTIKSHWGGIVAWARTKLTNGLLENQPILRCYPHNVKKNQFRITMVSQCRLKLANKLCFLGWKRNLVRANGMNLGCNTNGMRLILIHCMLKAYSSPVDLTA